MNEKPKRLVGTVYQAHTVIIIRTTRIKYIRILNHLVHIIIQQCWKRHRQHLVIIKIINYNNRILQLVQCLCHGLLRHFHANCKPIFPTQTNLICFNIINSKFSVARKNVVNSYTFPCTLETVVNITFTY